MSGPRAGICREGQRERECVCGGGRYPDAQRGLALKPVKERGKGTLGIDFWRKFIASEMSNQVESVGECLTKRLYKHYLYSGGLRHIFPQSGLDKAFGGIWVRVVRTGPCTLRGKVCLLAVVRFVFRIVHSVLQTVAES